MMRVNRSPMPMARSARRIILATIGISSCNTVAAWTKAAPGRFLRGRGGSLSRPCGGSRQRVSRPRIKRRQSAVRSNGRRDLVASHAPGAAARNRQIEQDKAIESGKFALIEDRIEALLGMCEKIGDSHLARQNKRDRPGVDAKEKQNTACELQNPGKTQKRQKSHAVEHRNMRKAEKLRRTVLE